MKAKDIVLQVSEETAQIMEEISEQLLEGTEDRFYEIKDSLENVTAKIKELYDATSWWLGDVKKEENNNHEKALAKFEQAIQILESLKNEGELHTYDFKQKVEELSSVITTIYKLLNTIGNEMKKVSGLIDSANKETLESNKHIENKVEVIQANQEVYNGLIKSHKATLDDIKNEAELLRKLQKGNNNQIDNLCKEIDKLSLGLSDGIKEITTLFDSINKEVVKSNKYFDKEIERVQESQGTFLREYIERNEAGLLQVENKIDEASNVLCSLARQVESIVVQQNEILAKQSVIENEIKYTKLPFYKRWFRKG